MRVLKSSKNVREFSAVMRLLSGPVAVREPGALGDTQGLKPRIFLATGSNRLEGTTLPGTGCRTQVPSAICTVDEGSKMGNALPPKLKSPFFMASVGVLTITCAAFFSMSF